MALSASSACARLVRGTMSMLSAVTPWADSLSVSAASCRGARKLMSTPPRRRAAIWSSVGGLTARTTSLCQAALTSPITAPASA